ncbi:MAG: hypothetical protein CMG78_11325 [Marinobacter sp.]|nr:hypothetical protein [Marinobacter sp.]
MRSEPECYKRAPVRVNPVLLHSSERRISMSGPWEFNLDPDDRGMAEGWFEDASFSNRITVPGTWQGQGFGGDDKDTLWAFRIQVRSFRATYQGSAWYARRFQVPSEWTGLRVWANFGGVHPSADVWLNGVKLGEHHEPFVPFAFEITDTLSVNTENLLVVRVHEQSRALGLAFNWLGNWSGLYRDVELTATGESFVDRFSVCPDVDRQCLAIKVWPGHSEQPPGPSTLRLEVTPSSQNSPVVTAEVPLANDMTEAVVPVSEAQLWSPDTPNLYRVDATLTQRDEVLDALSERVGFVKLSTRDKHFLINGEPYFMRGTGDFISSPETGCPDTNRDRWRQKLRTLREYGYNYVRCQSFVPAPEYFDVADEVGLLVQSEMGMLGAWTGGAGAGIWRGWKWPEPNAEFRHVLKRQWDNVVIRDVNHPSANVYCMSNELRSATVYPRTAWHCYRSTKAIKPSAFVIWTDGGFDEELPADFINHEAQDSADATGWKGVDDQTAKPVIQHEFRWWTSFPDVRITHKYAGAVRPLGAELALEAAARHGITHVLPQAAANSQRLQFVEAKGKMEMCRRDTPQLAGISHFMAMDLNMSPQGIIDEFYERKYADADRWLETNGDTVVLSSLGFDDRVLSSGDTLRCTLYVSDFSHPPFRTPTMEWQVVADQQVLGSGEATCRHQPYMACQACRIQVSIPEVSHPRVVILHALFRDGQRECRNRWDLWLLPKETLLPDSLALYGRAQHTWLRGISGVPVAGSTELAAIKGARAVLSERLDDTLVEYVRMGGRAILAASEGLVRPFQIRRMPDAERYFFNVIANDPPFDHGHSGTIISDHPMLGDLPHDGFADLQFFRLMGNAPPLDLEPLGLNHGDPVIRVMHIFPTGRPLAYLLEGSLGQGSLIVCALDLDQSLLEGRYLLSRICNYAVSDVRQPTLELSDDAITVLIRETGIP